MSVPPLSVVIPLRWSDMDAYDHVNNATFVTLLEQARVVALEEWFGPGVLDVEGVVVARQEIDYKAQLRYRPQPVVADVWCSAVGAASFDIACMIRDPEDLGGQRYVVAETRLVRYDAEAGRSRRLDDRFREVLQRWSGDPAPLFSRRTRGER